MINLLDALYKLGKLYIEKEDLNQIDVLLDNKKIGAVVLVEFIEDSAGNISYNKVYQEDYDSKNKVKYLYKKGSPRGTNITPSSLLGKDLKTTFDIKFFKWFDNNQDNDFFLKFYNEINDNKEEIFNDMELIINNINVKDNILISLVVNKNDDINYLNDFDEFKEILIKNSLDKYQGPKKIKGNGVCCLCDNQKEVYGLVSSSMGFAFSTPEKKGNVPGFDVNNQWKLLPICSDCALYLNAGKNFVEKYLNFKEFGLNYYVIPNFLFDLENGFDNFYNNIKLFEKNDALDSSDLIHIENKLGRFIKRIDDIAEFKFLFYQASKAEFKILAYVESVVPSWLTVLYKTQHKISEYDFFREKNLKLIFGEKHNGTFLDVINNNNNYPCNTNNWYKRFLRDFIFSFSSKMYIDSVVKIIGNKKIDYHFLMSRIMDKIRHDWRNEEHYAMNVSILKSLMLFLLLNDLNLIKGENIMNSNNEEEFDTEFLLDTPSKKATFLLGVLTRKLMNIQYKELGSTPFYNKLWGLSLDQKKIHKLYPMVINKLQEYGAGYMRDLENEISKNLAMSERNWGLNRDETSYYFVLGFTLHNTDKKEKCEDD